MWVADKDCHDFGIIAHGLVIFFFYYVNCRFSCSPYVFIYFPQYSVLCQIQSTQCKSAAFKSWQDNEKHIAMLEALFKVAAVTFLYFYETRATWSHCRFKLTCMSSVPFCQSQLHHDGDPARSWGLLTRKPRDIIWFHFHLNCFPLADLILVSQYEPWPWISTGLQLVFNVHQSLMWESAPHSGVLLTGPSPSRPTLGPSGPSRVPNHTSVSTVAKLLQSDWLGNTLMKKSNRPPWPKLHAPSLLLNMESTLSAHMPEL